MSGWQAGVSKVCITPEEPICLDGWGSRISQGVSMDIWAKAAAFATDGSLVHVIVSADLCGFSGSMAERLVSWAEAEHGMARNQLVLNCSHNHSGPVFEDTLPLYHDLTDDEYDTIKRYTLTLEDRVRVAITEAIASMAPARVSWGHTRSTRRDLFYRVDVCRRPGPRLRAHASSHAHTLRLPFPHSFCL